MKIKNTRNDHDLNEMRVLVINICIQSIHQRIMGEQVYSLVFGYGHYFKTHRLAFLTKTIAYI